MVILLLTPVIPFPLSEGGKISQYAVIDYLRNFHQIILVVISNNPSDENNLRELRLRWPNVEIRSVSTFKQPANISLGKKIANAVWWRANNLLEKFHQRISGDIPEEIPEIENRLWINIFHFQERLLIEQLTAILNDYPVDIVQIEFIWFVDLVLAIPDHIKKVFVHHEIRFARLISSVNSGTGSMGAFENYALKISKLQELSVLKLYDSIFVFSEDDKNKLEAELPQTAIHVTPFPVLEEYFIPITRQDLQIKKLVFIGGEEHAPNKDAVEWYIKEIGREVWNKQQLVLHIIGKWTAETINQYKGNPMVYFTGFVDDIISYCKNSIMLVPVRIGSGIRTKILYAIAQGVPVISATIGCEGIELKNKESILIADTPVEFSEAVDFLAKNPEATFDLAQKAQAVARAKYSQQYASELRMKYYNQLLTKT